MKKYQILGYNLPLLREAFPPESAPSGSAPVGVSPLRCSTDSDSSLKKWNEKYQNSECTSLYSLKDIDRFILIDIWLWYIYI